MDDDFFQMLPEGTRIVIRGNKVTFENLTEDMLDVAHALDPNNADIKERMAAASSEENSNLKS